MNRRAFLGAAAAAAALPATLDEAAGEQYVEEYRESDDGTYVEWNCGSVEGSMNGVEVACGMMDSPISVTAASETDGWQGVDLRWSSGPVQVDTGLSADAARELALRLWTAAEVLDGGLDAVDG